MDSIAVGTRLRAARETRRLSLRTLASSIGVSPSLLSQIENGKTQPSVSTLYAIVSELGLSTDDILGIESAAHGTPSHSEPAPQEYKPAPTTPIVQRGKNNPKIEMDNGVVWEQLPIAPGDHGDCEWLKVTYKPGASSSVQGRLMRHYGVEHAHILAGELTAQVEFDRVTLRAGDSMVFDSSRPHLFVNESDEEVQGIWFITGRRGAMAAQPEPQVAQRRAPEAGRPESAVDVLDLFRG